VQRLQSILYSQPSIYSAYHQLDFVGGDKPFTTFGAAGRPWECNCLPFGVANEVPAFQRTIDAIVDVEHSGDTYPYLDNVTVCGETQMEHDANVQRFLAALKDRNVTLNKSKAVLSVPVRCILENRFGHGVMKPNPER